MSRPAESPRTNPGSVIIGVRITVGLAGVIGIGYGLFLALTTLRRWPDVIATALWFGVPPVLSDLLVIPVIGLLGTVVAARVRSHWRAPVIIGLIISGALLAVGWPFLSGIGRRADNPSLLDRPYLLGTVLALAVIWAGVAAWALLRRPRPRSRTTQSSKDEQPEKED